MSTTPEAAVAASMSLRWAKCGDVYYAALLVPNEEAPIPVESGHAFVIFLGDETGAALPISDIEPYNPHDTTRTSHPEAAAGVLIAQQLIAGAEAAAAVAAEEQKGGEGEREEEEDWERLHEGGSHDNKKKKEKKSKSKEKHADKNDKKAEERSEELMKTQKIRPKKGRRHDSDEEEDNEEEDALLLPRGGSKRPRREKEDDDNEEEEDTTSSSEITSEGQEQQNRWDEMAEDLNLSLPSRMNGKTRGSTNNNNNNNKKSTGSTSANAASQQLALYGSANVTPFLAEIHHHYLKALVEASESDRLVNIQECDLVRAVEQELRSWSGEVAYLEQLLQDVEYEYNSLVSHTSQNDSNSVAIVEEEAAAIRSRLNRLKSSFSLERLVQEHLRVREKPAERRERRRPHHSSSSSAAGTIGTTAFVDASMAYLLDTKAAAAVPRELTHTLAQRYREQRVRRERLLASQQGLGKTGFTAPVSRVMEKWRRSRELMLIDPCRASQPVSRRYSESLAKVERHALKCLSAYSTSSTGGSAGVDRLLSTYQQQQQQQQQDHLQQRRFKPPVNLYHFSDLNEGETQLETAVYQASSSHPYMPNSGIHGGDNLNDDNINNNNNDNINNNNENDEGQNAFHVPLISPLRTSFDPRATFAVDPAEIMHEKALAEQLAMKSMQYSQSIFLPSEETAWESSEVYDAVQRKQRSGGIAGTAGRRSMSRASSRASSVVSDNTSCYNSTTYSNHNKPITSNGGKRSGETDRRPRSDWRASAKRTILEELTLYLRGRRGKPAVLNKEQFQFIAKKLLDRAVRSESERTGLSMSLQANNASAPFTKDIELRLRKSVDNYIQRHFAAARTPAQQQQYDQQQQQKGRSADMTAATSMDRTTSARRAALQRQDDDDETRSVMGAHLHTTDSPVYDDL